jgi:hypothetical protein
MDDERQDGSITFGAGADLEPRRYNEGVQRKLLSFKKELEFLERSG